MIYFGIAVILYLSGHLIFLAGNRHALKSLECMRPAEVSRFDNQTRVLQGLVEEAGEAIDQCRQKTGQWKIKYYQLEQVVKDKLESINNQQNEQTQSQS